MACDSEKKIDGFTKWEIESAARTLMEAIEIKGKPKLLALAQKEATKQARLAEAASLEKKVSAKLVQTFGSNNPKPHKKNNPHKGGY